MRKFTAAGHNFRFLEMFSANIIKAAGLEESSQVGYL